MLFSIDYRLANIFIGSLRNPMQKSGDGSFFWPLFPASIPDRSDPTPQLVINIDLRKSFHSAKKGITKSIGKKHGSADELDAEAADAEPASEPTGIPIITCINTTKEVSSVASSVEKLDTEENLTSSMELETEENRSNPGTYSYHPGILKK